MPENRIEKAYYLLFNNHEGHLLCRFDNGNRCWLPGGAVKSEGNHCQLFNRLLRINVPEEEYKRIATFCLSAPNNLVYEITILKLQLPADAPRYEYCDYHWISPEEIAKSNLENKKTAPRFSLIMEKAVIADKERVS